MNKPELNDQRFTRADVLEVVDVTPTTFQNWLQRGQISVSPKQKGGAGNRRLFSIMDIVKFASLAQLGLFKIPPSEANQIVSADAFVESVSEIYRERSENQSKDASVYLLIVLHSQETFAAYTVTCQSEWEAIDSEHGNLTIGAKAYFTLRLGDVVDQVKSACTMIVLKSADPSTLSVTERSTLLMRERLELDQRIEAMEAEYGELRSGLAESVADDV